MGGESFGLGYLEEINALTGQTKQILKIDHELDAIQAVDENRWVIAGYGVVFYSEDAGMQWDTLDVSGDHYRDVFVDEQTGFIVGIQGSILRSDDGGKNWKNCEILAAFSSKTEASERYVLKINLKDW